MNAPATSRRATPLPLRPSRIAALLIPLGITATPLPSFAEARGLIGSAHKLYRGALAFYLRGRDLAQLDSRGLQLVNVMLNAGLQPVREEDEVAPLNSYLRWLPCVFDPALDKRQWYTQLMFAQHAANLAPVWGRSQGTGHPGITFFNRGGGPITFDPLNRLDRQMNAHLFLFGPTGSGKSATLNNILNQVTAIYRPRLFIVEAGNSLPSRVGKAMPWSCSTLNTAVLLAGMPSMPC